VDACNLDAGGARKRLVLGIVFLILGFGFAAWFIAHGRPLTLRIPATLPCFLIASYSLLQARAKT
jgi:hypothetical protein